MFFDNNKHRVILLEDCLVDLLDKMDLEELIKYSRLDRMRCVSIKAIVEEIKEKRNLK